MRFAKVLRTIQHDNDVMTKVEIPGVGKGLSYTLYLKNSNEQLVQ